MSDDNGPRIGWCNLCKPPSEQRLDDIYEHLREVHGFDEEIQQWPDGSPVIIDETLEPTDFSNKQGLA